MDADAAADRADADVVTGIFDAFNRRALDEILELADPEIELRPLRMAGREVLHGHEGIRQLDQRFQQLGLDHKINIAEVRRLADGSVAAIGQVTMGGAAYDFVGVHVVRDGRVAFAHHMFSDDAVLRQLGLLDESAGNP